MGEAGFEIRVIPADIDESALPGEGRLSSLSAWLAPKRRPLRANTPNSTSL